MSACEPRGPNLERSNELKYRLLWNKVLCFEILLISVAHGLYVINLLKTNLATGQKFCMLLLCV